MHTAFSHKVISISDIFINCSRGAAKYIFKDWLFYYNYHVKGCLSIDGQRDSINERSTLIKFTFENDMLSSWEEDNLTLGMSHSKKTRPTSVIRYVNLFINIILLVAVFGGS